MDINSDYIIPYLQGKLTAEECAAVRHLMKTSPEFKREVDNAFFVSMASKQLKRHQKTDTVEHWKQLSHRIFLFNLRTKVWNVTRTAAALLLPLLLVTYSLLEYNKKQEPIPEELVEVTSAYGLISKVALPDGSIVWLNSGSKLVYPTRFEEPLRKVELSGEAYFKVKANPNHRFDVRIPNGMIVSAFGTEFNINAYEEDEKCEAVLSEGHIAVSLLGYSQQENLLPGKQVVFYKGDSVFSVIDANVYASTAWKDGKMVFRRAKMDEIVKKLSRHFNVDIKLEGRVLYEYEYSATFTTESLNQILDLLAKSAPIEWQSIEPDKQIDLTYARRKIIIKVKN